MATLAEKKSFVTDPPSDQSSSDNNTIEKQEDRHDSDGDPGQADPDTEVSPRQVHGWKWAVTSAALLSSIFLYALDCTVVADIQAQIVNDFNALDKLSWMSTGFLMPATAVVLPWGRVYAQFNAKRLYLFSMVLFEVGSAVCGAAPNINAMIVGRAIVGIGGTGIYMGVMTLIAATTTMRERPLYVGLTGVTWGLGVVLGPIIGGAFSVSAVGWRWAFYINLLVFAAAAPAYILLLPNHIDPRPGVSWRVRLAEMDHLGNLLLIGAILTFIMAINWGGVTYPWRSGQVIGCFCASGVLFLLLAVQQVRTITTTITSRIIPLQAFGNPTVLLLFACCAAGGASAFVPIYFVPTFFQFTTSSTALEAGVRLLPLIIVMVIVIILNGGLMSRLGYYTPWFTLGGLLAMTGAALMYTVRLDTSDGRIYGYTVILGVGVGMWLQAPFSVAQAVVEPHDIPAVVSFMMLGQYVGITFALAIANTVFLNDTERAIAAILPDVSTETITEAMEGASNGFFQSLDGDVQTQVLEAIVAATDKAYILVIVAGGLTAVLSLFMKRQKLFGSGGIHVA